MSKEMYISSSPHETKVAVLEDDQLVEVYFERDTDVGLVGGIYKGRVSRVLPGMQSAFVDIGLERDAFLYVSDFFYENQEEYDKVFEEAEVRASKFTAQQAKAPESPVAPPATQLPPAAALEVAPTPVPTPPVESPAATVTPPVPASAAPTSREPYERRPFDPRRGRRRRHRGRPEFGEGRQGERGERRFPPLNRAEEPPTESHPFEVLPGESLAKYSHAVPTESGNGAETIAATENAAGVDDDFASAHSAVVQAHERSETESAGTVAVAADSEAEPAKASPAPEPVAVSEVELAPPAEVSAQAPAAAVTAVVTDAMPPFAPGATQSTALPGGAVSTEVAEPPAAANVTSASEPQQEPAPAQPSLSAPVAPAAASEREPEIPASPASASFPADVAASYAVEGISGPSSGEPEPTGSPVPSEKVAVEGADTAAPEVAPPATSSEAAEVALPSERAELNVLDENGEEEIGEEDLADDGEDEEFVEGAESEFAAEGELAAKDDSPEEVAAGPDGEAQPAASESGEVPSSGEPGAPGDRTYTLREPNQRPRFAPRRRRGRRAPGGGPRRFDKPREATHRSNHHPVQIAEVLKEGQEILVQIAKEPLGTKGARITSHVALPGRYLVYMPTIEHIGVSRKIASEEERLRLRNIILENKGALTGGFIVRTAGQGRSEEEFKADLKFLSTLWARFVPSPTVLRRRR